MVHRGARDLQGQVPLRQPAPQPLVFTMLFDTTGALIIVGVMMAEGLGQIAWDRMEIAIPAFVTVITMPLTFSIANGIALGLILYPLLMVFRGRAKEGSATMYGLAVVLLAYFLFFVE